MNVQGRAQRESRLGHRLPSTRAYQTLACTGFQQIATDSVAQRDTGLASCSSRGPKSGMGPSGLKSRSLRGCAPSGSSRGGRVSQLLGPPVCLGWGRCLLRRSKSLRPLLCRRLSASGSSGDPCDYTGPTRSPKRASSSLKTLHFILFAKSLLDIRSCIQVPRDRDACEGPVTAPKAIGVKAFRKR